MFDILRNYGTIRLTRVMKDGIIGEREIGAHHDTLTGAQLLTRSLAAVGARTVFGPSGNQVMPVYDACIDEGIPSLASATRRPMPTRATA